MQIVNRDLSIAVLRAFEKKRQEEFTNERKKKAEDKQKPNKADDAQLPVEDVRTNECDQEKEKNSENGARAEIVKPMQIKPMRILEACILNMYATCMRFAVFLISC